MKKLKVESEQGINRINTFTSGLSDTQKQQQKLDAVLEKINKPLAKVWLGIDPGKLGGLVAIHESGIIETHAIPLIKKEVDEKALIAIVEKYLYYNTTVIMENVHSIYGVSAKSNFTFGFIVGLLQNVVISNKLAYIKVSPKKWQELCFLGIPKIAKTGKKEKGKGVWDNKAMALIAAQRLFPKLDLRKSSRCTNAHDGIVDALLMAHYGKVTHP